MNWCKPLRQKAGIDRVVAWNTYVEEKREASRGCDNSNVPNIDTFLSINSG
jgi:hypothetical protein